MKKLVCVLLMLALLCGGVAAMAAEIPNKLTGSEDFKYSLRPSRGGSRIEIEKENYTARYYFSGALESYTYNFECGCQIDYNPFGELMDAPIRRNLPDNVHLIWDSEAGKWVGGECSDGHTPAEHIKNPPVAYKNVDGKIPPLTAVEASTTVMFASYDELKTAALIFFASDLDNETGEVVANDEINRNGVKYELALVKKNGMYGRYTNGKFVETYIGSLVINKDDEQCWFGGNADYGINTEGFYNWETGELEEYKFYTADRSMNAMYSLKNVLRSYETWDDKGAWWGFFENHWECAEDGDPEHSKPATPDEKILEKILHAPAPATYESACVTSESQLKEDQKGVPFILASASDINNATVKTTAEQTGARSTEFDISLLNASGEEVDLAADSVTLTLGYPAGMPQDVSKNYEFAVVHTLDDGTEEVMTTMTNNVKLTANGPQVTATGFSPYTVIWGTADELAEYAKKAEANMPGGPGDIAPDGAEAMPQTGDDSMLLVWAALLAVSCTALVMKKRSRA